MLPSDGDGVLLGCLKMLATKISRRENNQDATDAGIASNKFLHPLSRTRNAMLPH